MPGDMETELKLKLLQPVETAEVWQSLLNAAMEQYELTKWSTIAMEAWYFDTDEQSLQKAGIAYRVRREGEGWTATVKTDGVSDGGMHQRHEWNVVSPDQQPRPELFSDLPIGVALLEAVGDRILAPRFSTVFERRVAEVMFEDACIELAVDFGLIIAGERNEPINELELELKSGAKTALLRLGAIIARQLPVVPEHKSKFYRALVLAGFDDLQSKTILDVRPQAETVDGLSVLMVDRVAKLFKAYHNFIEQPGSVESTRQLRIKLRRLRSVLLLSKPCLAEADYQAWRQVFKEVSGTLGPVRDLDVLAAEWEELCSSPYITFDSKPWLGDNIDKRRVHELELAKDKLNQFNLCARLMEFWAWIESKPWQPRTDTIGSYARWRIGGWLAALLDSGKTANWENDEELHALRLKLKRIRYTLEVMPFYNDRRTEKLLAHAKSMQSLFGAINDRAVSGQTLSLLARGATRAVYRDIGILRGWQGKSEQSARTHLQDEWKNFRQTAKRWLEA